MSYIDGFVLPIPKKNVDRYREMAAEAGKFWMRLGALQYIETILDDDLAGAAPQGDEPSETCGVPFTKAFNVKQDETVAFSYIVYKSREHRDEVNKKIMADKDLMDFASKYANVFDEKRMAYSGFKPIVEL